MPERSGGRPPAGAADKAIRERERLWRHYRSDRLSRRQELYDAHPQGWMLKEFHQQLRRFTAADAAAFLTYVREANRQWLITAPPELRAEALTMVNERIQRIRVGAGQVPMDDPLPEEEDDIYQLCKRELV